MPEILSVGRLTAAIKEHLEPVFADLRVRGEISNFRRQASGHCYFTLKDEASQLPCVMFRGRALRLFFDPKPGDEVVCAGELSVYPPHGKYQLVVRDMEPGGTGRLQRQFEALKQKLKAEGLFDAGRKRPLPALPRRLAVLTSPTGAALRDFLSILRRRGWRGLVHLYPSVVQGADAVPSMLEQLERVREGGPYDLVVVGRGGGSLEDLWAFNEESLVRALTGFPVPVISAVGHEIDFVLTDFVADVRAETPSAAAELISSLRLEAVQGLDDAVSRLLRGADAVLNDAGQALDLLAARLHGVSPERRFRRDERRLRELSERLGRQLHATAQAGERCLRALEQRLRDRHPMHALPLFRQRVDDLERRLRAAGVESTLKRGFALVRDADGRVVSKRRGLKPGRRLTAEFQDGAVGVEVGDPGKR